MTSSHGSSSRKFAVVAQIDDAAIRRVNAALLRLGREDAGKAMKRGLRKWGSMAKKAVAAAAPMGRMSSVEHVRGLSRPNVHLKFNAHVKTKGYRKGLVQWIAVGIKEIPGSYLTPHWYLRWVENGHAIKRKATQTEREMLRARGEKMAKNMRTIIGRVAPNPFVRRTAQAVVPLAEGFLMTEIDKEIAKVGR